jgi:hypothetical protein
MTHTTTKKPSAGFSGIFIPRDLWLKDGLSVTEKLLAAVVDSLDQGDGCWASNDYLGTIMGLSERQVRDYLVRLESFGILLRKQEERGRRIYSVYADAIRNADLPLAKDDSGEAESRQRGAAENRHGGRRNPATNSKENKKEEIYTQSEDIISLSIKGQNLNKEQDARLRTALASFVTHLIGLNRKVTVNSLNAQVEFLRTQTGDWSNLSIAEEIITQSVRQGWVGLFPLRKSGDAPKKVLNNTDHNGAF